MSENTNSAGMSQLQRLKALQEENKAKSQKANMTAFNNLIGVYVGTPAREHFPKIKDENTHTFSEFGTSKMIQIVLPKEYNLQLMSAYKLSGLGYDIKGSMFYIEQNGTISSY